MVNATNGSERRGSIDDRAAEFERWRELVRATPDVRIDRVLATRDALRENRYDDADIFNYTVQCVGNELGVMCRGEWADPGTAG
jgi:hypothetical protein